VGDTIAITGAAGLIGTLLCNELERDYDLRRIDRAWRSGLLRRRHDTRRTSLAERLFAGATTVIDLASDPGAEASWATVLNGNLPAAVSVYEAARRAGVRRVIYASSNRVTGLYERDEPYASICAGRYEGLEPSSIPMIGASSPIRPDGPYAVGKAAAEAAGRYYADEHGLSVICIRFGTVYPADRPGSPRGYATMLSRGDLARLVRACITAPPELQYGILYGVSANTWRFWDLRDAARLVGFEPLDDSERLRTA
jgi:nucleoside-diphosphate-sugar epimerase